MPNPNIHRIRGGRKHKSTFHGSIEGELRSFDVHNSTCHHVANGLGSITSELGGQDSETVEDHIVPRVSVTDKQELRLKVRPIKGISLKAGRILMKDGEYTKDVDGNRVIDTPNPARTVKITLMSDRTLLQRGNPFRDTTPETIKRRTSKSKRLTYPDSNLKQSRIAPTAVELPFNCAPSTTEYNFSKSKK